MANNEHAVRDAASALQKAITEATAAGYRIHWPSNVAGLESIAISETGAVKRHEPKPSGSTKAPAPTKPAGVVASS